MEKNVFDLESRIKLLFSESQREFNYKVNVADISDAIFSFALNNAGNKINLLCTDSDFSKIGLKVTSAIKKACVEFSTFLIHDKAVDYISSKALFDFDGDVVLVLGNQNLISVTSYYASIKNLKCYSVLTEPNFDYLFLPYTRVPVNGLPVNVSSCNVKELFIDLEVIKKASNTSFAESFLSSISKLVTLVDYKFHLLVKGEKFDSKSYNKIKQCISLVADINSYTDKRDILIYASAVLATERVKGNVLTDGIIELFSDVCSAFDKSLSYGKRVLSGLKSIVPIYEMLLINDFTDILSTANYNEDVSRLATLTGRKEEFFRKHLQIPPVEEINKIKNILNKTRSGFIKEIESILLVLKHIEDIYASLLKSLDYKKGIDYSIKKDATQLCTYLTSRKSLLSYARDLGVLSCLKD